jgi:hypothetical protein
MPKSLSVHARQFRTAAIAACGAAAVLVLPAPAHAQSLLESIFNAIGGRSTPAPTPVHVDPAARDAWSFAGRDARNVASTSLDRTGLHDMPSSTYCVRLCDGRYFPLPRKAGAVNMSSAQICSAMCPAAKTEVFNGKIIDHAISSEGKPYKSIKNAFVYRSKNVEDCTCKHGGASGVAGLDVMDDPTLRRGDIVVTRDGPVVYTGERGKDRERAFVHPDEFKGLPQSVRHELATMRVARDANETASLPADAAPVNSSGSVQSISYTPARVAPVEVTPVAEAFSSFVQ